MLSEDSGYGKTGHGRNEGRKSSDGGRREAEVSKAGRAGYPRVEGSVSRKLWSYPVRRGQKGQEFQVSISRILLGTGF